MIIIFFKKKVKCFHQHSYNNLIYSLNINDLSCPNCKSCGFFHHHGTYKRSVIIHGEPEPINIIRLKCTACNSTHALLLAGMVPYSRNIYLIIVEFNLAIISLSTNLFNYVHTCFDRVRSFRCVFFYPT